LGLERAPKGELGCIPSTHTGCPTSTLHVGQHSQPSVGHVHHQLDITSKKIRRVTLNRVGVHLIHGKHDICICFCQLDMHRAWTHVLVGCMGSRFLLKPMPLGAGSGLWLVLKSAFSLRLYIIILHLKHH
jgi:hypothetical protein